MSHYFSIKTKKEEHCIEPLIGGDFYYAVYDNKRDLIGEKKTIKKTEAVEFYKAKEKELKKKWERVNIDKKEEPKETEPDEFERIFGGQSASSILDKISKITEEKGPIKTKDGFVGAMKVGPADVKNLLKALGIELPEEKERKSSGEGFTVSLFDETVSAEKIGTEWIEKSGLDKAVEKVKQGKGALSWTFLDYTHPNHESEHASLFNPNYITEKTDLLELATLLLSTQTAFVKSNLAAFLRMLPRFIDFSSRRFQYLKQGKTKGDHDPLVTSRGKDTLKAAINLIERDIKEALAEARKNLE